MGELEIALDDKGNKIVLLPDVIFSNKQKINWDVVEPYLQCYVGEIITIADTGESIHIGKDFPDEYTGSKYTRTTKRARAKAKANADQGIREITKIATNKIFRRNKKEKHSYNAAGGWSYYTIRFAMPIYNNDIKTDNYNIYSGCLVVNRTER